MPVSLSLTLAGVVVKFIDPVCIDQLVAIYTGSLVFKLQLVMAGYYLKHYVNMINVNKVAGPIVSQSMLYSSNNIIASNVVKYLFIFCSYYC